MTLTHLDLLLVHAAATLAMTGLIWFVQVCHYPHFALVPPPDFPRYHAAYTRSTGFVIVPLMLLELGCSLALVILPHPAQGLAWLGLALLAVIWASTFLLQVPAHAALARGFDAATHQRLVASNWLRTVAWTLRGVLAFLLIRLPPCSL